MANPYPLFETRQFSVITAKIVEILVAPMIGWLLGVIMTLSSVAFITAPAYAAVILGNATIGSVVDSGDSNYLNGSKVSVGSTNIAVTSMSVFVGSVDAAPNNQYQVAIYTDLNGVPGTLVVSSTTGTLTPNAWNTRPLAATLQANTSYWLMYNTNGRTAAVNNLYYTNGSQGQGAYSTNLVPFGSWPGTFGAATLTNTVYSLYATANSSSDSIPQTVSIIAPSQSAVVSGVISVSADATDNVSVASVQFQVDGVNIGGEVSTAPYTSPWNTALTPNGNHTLTAIAKDTVGNQTTSSPIVVTISNTDVRSSVGEWSPVLNWPLIAIHASLLKNGKVLVIDHEYTTTQPMLWDPTTQTFTDTPLVNHELFCAGHTQLADGRFIAAGGHKPDRGQVGINTIYLYDPDTNIWTRSSDMAYDRWYPAVTKLSDGRVYILSGQITDGVFADTPEIYNPANGSVTAVPTISTIQLHEEEYPANFHLPSGMILAISPEHGPVQLLDPIVSTWTSVNTTPILFGSAVQYRPGKILMLGGGASFLSPSVGRTALLDMNAANPTWRQTAPMSFGRYMHNLVMLPTGDVLAVGGSNTVDQRAADGPLPVERWNPNTESWTTLAALQVPRMYHSTAMLLPDGRVLAAGGGHNASAPNHFSAQVYSPPYLFKGQRPTITSAPDAVPYGSSSFTVSSPDASTIMSVALVALSSPTHSTDMNQFYTELQFNKTANQLNIAAPQDGNQVPPSYYMLFIVNTNGIPSVAKILKIGPGSPPPADTTPPTVTGVTPTNGATNVLVTTTVTATFSEAMDAGTISTSTVELRNAANALVAATVSYTAGTRTATLTPSSALANGTQYTATVRGGSTDPRVKDMAGNALANTLNWAFTTATTPPADTTPPTVSSVTPANGATGVATGTTVTATFSEAMNVSTISTSTVELRNASNTLVAATVSYTTGTRTATLTPSSALAQGVTYTATVRGGSSGVKDVAGNALANTLNWAFTTVGPPPPSSTIGLTTIGSFLDSGDNNFLNGSKVNTTSGGNIVSMSVYVSNIDSTTSNRNYQLAIYTDNGGRPGTLVAKTVTGTLVANSWNTRPITTTLQPNTAYWLMYNTNGRIDAVNNMRHNNGSSGQGVYSTNSVKYGTWPTSFPAATLTNAIYSLYATFGP